MENASIGNKKMVFFGDPLDCDEKEDSIQEKLSSSWVSAESDDPFDLIMEMVRKEAPHESWEDIGSLRVPGWLRPKPSDADKANVRVDQFVAFIDQEGCREAASQVETLVSEQILPNIPCMIAVDHSLTGGAFKALAKLYGKENLSLVILDSHTDALPMSVLAGAIQYDMETNPTSLYDQDDPFLYDRPDSYNASSFVWHMLSEESVLPENLYLVGVSDYPQKRAFRIKDPRILRYVGVYSGMKRKGVKVITKKDCLTHPTKLKNALTRISTPYVYISIDMDIGARNAVEGVRFRDWQGLNQKQICRIADILISLRSQGIQLAGMDITEINTRRAGGDFASGRDQTCELAAKLICKLKSLSCERNPAFSRTGRLPNCEQKPGFSFSGRNEDHCP